MNAPNEERPRPIKSAADQLRAWVGLASALVAAAGTGGILLDGDQVSGLQGVLAAVVPLVTATGIALTAFGIVKRSEPLVTPLESPQDREGNALVPMPGYRPPAP